MRINRSLLDDVEKIYFSIPCTSGVSCEHCKNKVLCDLSQNLLNDLFSYTIFHSYNIYNYNQRYTVMNV